MFNITVRSSSVLIVSISLFCLAALGHAALNTILTASTPPPLRLDATAGRPVETGAPNADRSLSRDSRVATQEPGSLARTAPARKQKLKVGSVELDHYAIVWFLLVVALEVIPGLSAVPGGIGRFRIYQFCLAVLGLGAALSAIGRLGHAISLVAFEDLVALCGVIGIFSVVALSSEAWPRLGWRQPFGDIALFARSATTWMCVAAFLGFIQLVGAGKAKAANPALATARFSVWYASQKPQAIPEEIPTAPVLVLKFNDYQCPPCRAFEKDHRPIFDKLSQDHPGKLRLITLDYPLEPECNPYVTQAIHSAACEAAVAMRLADERGSAAAMETWLWANQETLSSDSVTRAARDVGGISDFSARYASEVAKLRQSVELGHRLGVKGTPTIVINGKTVPFGMNDNFEAALLFELRDHMRSTQ